MSIQEGKRPFTFAGFVFLASVFMVLTPQGRKYSFMESTFAWCFQVLMWNLLARSSNTIGIMLPHIFWREDCLVVHIKTTKSDKSGASYGKEKHVYANPLMPMICPMLSMGVMLLCRHRSDGKADCGKNDNALFTGDSVDRFGTVLRKVLHDQVLVPETVDLGAVKADLGTHSNRKGAGTFLCGLSVAINAIAVFLRAGWSIGKVQSKYIMTGSAADQIVGRAVAGLPLHDSNFAVLPPHFTRKGLERLQDIGMNQIVPNFDKFPDGLQKAFPYLLASVIYHHDFLKGELSAQHPLWLQRLFTQPVTLNDGTEFDNAFTALKGEKHLVTGVFKDREVGMKASGLPPHLVLACKLDTIAEQVSKLRESYEERSESNFEKIIWNCLLQKNESGKNMSGKTTLPLVLSFAKLSCEDVTRKIILKLPFVKSFSNHF